MRHRSPEYPAVSLPKAIEATYSIYQKVAFAPTVFRALQSTHRNSLEVPGDFDLQAHLQRNKFSQSAVRKVAFVYRETIKFVKKETQLAMTQAREQEQRGKLLMQAN